MELALTASRDVPGCMVRFSSEVAGRTLTSAPVSTRNCRLEIESYTHKQETSSSVTARYHGY